MRGDISGDRGDPGGPSWEKPLGGFMEWGDSTGINKYIASDRLVHGQGNSKEYLFEFVNKMVFGKICRSLQKNQMIKL